MSDGSTSIALESDDVLVDAQPRPLERRAGCGRVGQRLEEVAADDPEDVEPPGRRGLDLLDGRPSRERGRREAPDLLPAVERRAGPSSGTQPTSAPPWTPEWPRIGVRPAPGRPASPRARPTLTSARIVSTPWACWVSPIDQTKWARGRSTRSRRANSPHRRLGCAAGLATAPPSSDRARRRRPRRSLRVRAATNSSSTRRRDLEQSLEDAVQEREIAAGVHVEPVVGEPGPEERALGDGRHPVALEPRLAVRVDDARSARRSSSASWRYFVVTGWLLGTFEPKKTIRSDVEPVAVAAGRRAVAEHPFHGRRSRRHGRGGRSCPRGWCRGSAPPSARRSRSRWGSRARSGRRRSGSGRPARRRAAGEVERLVPGTIARNPPRRAGAPSARAGGRAPGAAAKTAARGRATSASLAGRAPASCSAQQLQAHHAEVRALDRPVAQAGRAERAAVADAPRSGSARRSGSSSRFSQAIRAISR